MVATEPMSPEVEAVRSLEARARAAFAQSDACRRAVALNELLGEIDVLKKQISTERSLAVFEANEGDGSPRSGVSLAKLADHLNVSKTLIQQLQTAGRRIAEDRARDQKRKR